MGDNQKEIAIRDFVATLENKNVEGALDFFGDDCEWVANEGVFKGKTEIKAYIEWLISAIENIRFSDEGIGIITDGDAAVYQHAYEGDYSGRRVRINGVCTYRFSGNKCVYHFTSSDRLSTASQAAGAFSGLAVDAIIRQVEKGL